MNNNYKLITDNFPGSEKGKPLHTLTSIGIGGPADLYLAIKDTNLLPSIIKTARQNNIPLVVFGGGSNLVFADEGFRGLVVQIKANNIIIEDDIITAEAGALVSQIIQKANESNLSGLEKLTGLPGTIGGAVRGNAGAYGTEIKDVLTEIEIFDPKNGIRKIKANELNFAYRESSIKNSQKDEVILKATLKLKKESPEYAKKMKAQIADILKTRAGKQPTGKTTGSFFKNPNPKLSAGYLLDQVGAKGLQIGGARVSKEHANWIVNTGNATQKDIIELAKILIEKVSTRFNIQLEPEVQLIGEHGFISI